MIFTREELMVLEDPYKALNSQDALLDNFTVIDALNHEEKKSLATKIIAGCPKEEFDKYIGTLGVLKRYQGSFCSVIMEAYEVRLLISALLDPQNRNSYTLFLDLGSTPGSFHQFPDLVKPVLGRESAIAETLALYVPKARRSHIAYNMCVCFPESTLSDRILKAFILRRDIENFLLENKPEQFFGSRGDLRSPSKESGLKLISTCRQQVEPIKFYQDSEVFLPRTCESNWSLYC